MNPIQERITLPDRIQLSCSINFIDETKTENREIITKYRDQTLTILKDHTIPRSFHWEKTIIREDNKRKIFRHKVFYADPINESLYKELLPELSHVRIRLENPFTVTAEFNFIKYLHNYLTQAEYYDKDTKPNSTISGSNFIPSDYFSQLTDKTDIIRDLIYSVPDTITKFSQYIITKIIPDFQHQYQKVMIKQIEFNRDYKTPLNRSAEYQHRIHEYLTSYQGIDYLRTLGSYFNSHYSTQTENTEETLHVCGDLTCPTLKYFLKDGTNTEFIIKIYRKDYDLIRLECTFIGDYIKKKCKYQTPDGQLHYTQNYQKTIDKLYEIANQFFHKAQFTDIIQIMETQLYNDKYAYLSDILDFYDTYAPNLSIINDTIMHRTPVKEPTTVKYILSNPQLFIAFKKGYDKQGHQILFYKPHFRTDRPSITQKVGDLPPSDLPPVTPMREYETS